MYSYAYAKMGNQCSPQTIALSSNTKFYKPYDEIYYTDWRRTFILDNHSENIPKPETMQQPIQQHLSSNIYTQFNQRNR